MSVRLPLWSPTDTPWLDVNVGPTPWPTFPARQQPLPAAASQQSSIAPNPAVSSPSTPAAATTLTAPSTPTSATPTSPTATLSVQVAVTTPIAATSHDPASARGAAITPSVASKQAPPIPRPESPESPNAPLQKRCSDCGLSKLESDFFSWQWSRAPAAKPRCKLCIANHPMPSAMRERRAARAARTARLTSEAPVSPGVGPRPATATSAGIGPRPAPIVANPAAFVPVAMRDPLAMRACDACISHKPASDFSVQQWYLRQPPRRCLMCEEINNIAYTQRCGTCKQRRSRHEFAACHWLKGPKRCDYCVNGLAQPVDFPAIEVDTMTEMTLPGEEATQPHRLRQCERCHQYKTKPGFNNKMWYAQPILKRHCLDCQTELGDVSARRAAQPAAPTTAPATATATATAAAGPPGDVTIVKRKKKKNRKQQRRQAKTAQLLNMTANYGQPLPGPLSGPLLMPPAGYPLMPYGFPPMTPQSILNALQAMNLHASAMMSEHYLSPTDDESGDDWKEEARSTSSRRSWPPSESTCAVCHSAQCGVMLLPCCHVSCCFNCAWHLKQFTLSCPRCDVRVDAFVLVRLYS